MKKSPGNNGMKEMQMELKYCERCGGLWFRPCGVRQVYCAHCMPAIAELPAPSIPLQWIKQRSSPDFELESRDLEDKGFDINGVSAETDLNAAGGVA
jgi:hypothetical protein